MRHKIAELEQLAKQARRTALLMIASLGKGHVGGALSIVDLLVVLYYEQMNIDPSQPHLPGRDRLVLSKGHGGPGLYALLSMKGYFDHQELYTLNQPGTILPSHCDHKLTPGIDMTTGSLGQGLSAAIGMALADRLNQNNAYTYCILGDGESQEGQIWEASMYASQAKLGHLIALLDQNGQQIDGPVDSINTLGDAAGKWRAFGWDVQELDGHDLKQINDAIEKAKKTNDRPHMLVLKTIKGKGWKKIEGTTKSHSMAVTPDDLQNALDDLL